MTVTDGATALVDFAIVGNDTVALAWLEEALAGMPGVALLGDDAPPPATNGRVGRISAALGAEPGPAWARAGRIAVVLRDPVAAAIERRDAASPGYAPIVGPLLAELGERALVLAGDELAEGAGALFAHLGLPEVPGEATPPQPAGRPIPPGRRAVLFAAVRDDVEELERLSGRVFWSWRPGTARRPEPAGAPAVVPDPPSRPGVQQISPAQASLVYAGRRRDIAGPRVITDWQTRPVLLAPWLNEAESLTVLDAMSFPFDALRSGDRDIPLGVQLPGQWDAAELTSLFGTVLLERLTPFDHVAIDDDDVWQALRSRHGWPETMRIPAGELLTLACRPPAGTRWEKSMFRALAKVLRPQLRVADQLVPGGEQPSVLLLAGAPSRWASLLSPDRHTAEVIATDRADAAAYPEFTFSQRGAVDPSAPETAHAVLAVDALCRMDVGHRRAWLRSLLRSLRVGGRLIVAERFLEGRGGRLIGAPRPNELLHDVLVGSDRLVVLEHVEAVRLHDDDVTSCGVFTFSKLGRPERL